MGADFKLRKAITIDAEWASITEENEGFTYHYLDYAGRTSLDNYLSPTNLICITLYNEPVEAFLATLSALLISLLDFATERPALERANSCVCILADGAEKLSASIMRFLVENQLFSTENSSLPNRDLHFSSLDAGALLDAMGTRPQMMAEHAALVNFVVCVKPENRGKLDSHGLFFGHLCTKLNPNFCYQLDTGTKIHMHAMRYMVHHMELQPNVGALASRVKLPAARSRNQILHAWQFFDFATQAAYSLPAELACGHLSVLPGQFSGTRWLALTSEARPGSKDLGSPVERYLRGTNPSTHLERLMFLAEDRVLGNEIVFAGNRDWKLDLCADAHAVTDACRSMSELLQQRRRWINSTTACRLWMLGKLPDQLTRADRSRTRKLHFTLAMLWQLLTIILQFITPAVTICTWVCVWLAIQRSGPLVEATTLISIAAAAILISYTPYKAPKSTKRIYPVCRDIASACAFVSITMALATGFSWRAPMILMLPIALAAFKTALTDYKHRWLILRRFFEYSWFVNPIIQTLLVTYSVFKFHDLSWGTKGQRDSNLGMLEFRKLRNWRDLFFAGWLVLNLCAVGIGLSLPGIFVHGLSPLAELSGLSLLFTLMICKVTV